MPIARTTRLTMDLPFAVHRRLKTESGKSAVPMRVYAYQSLLARLDQDAAATVHHDTQGLLELMRQEHAEQLRTLTDRTDAALASVRQDLRNHTLTQTESLDSALEDMRNTQPITPGPSGSDGIEQMDRVVEMLSRLTPMPALMGELMKKIKQQEDINVAFIDALKRLDASVAAIATPPKKA